MDKELKLEKPDERNNFIGRAAKRIFRKRIRRRSKKIHKFFARRRRREIDRMKKREAELQMLATAAPQLLTRPPKDPRANQYTVFGLRSIMSCVSNCSNGIWQDLLLLMLQLWAKYPLANRLIQDLEHWESQSTVDWEHTLMFVMARYTLPSPQSRGVGNLPTVHFAVGDVCGFYDAPDGRLISAGASDGSRLHIHTQGLPPVGSNSSLTATNSLASYDSRLVEHVVDSGVVWTSYIIDLKATAYFGRRDTHRSTFGMDITLNLSPDRSQHMLWCDMRHSLDSTLGTGHGPDSLSELELVVSISIIARIQLNAALDEYWNETTDYREWERLRRWYSDEASQNPYTIADKNPFAAMKLYFHRHDTASASLREYWGFWSLDRDPTAETGLEDCKEEIKLEVTTLPMENELDRKIKRREEERLAGIPGGWN